MSWKPELEELRRREALAREMGGEERVARQHASGRRRAEAAGPQAVAAAVASPSHARGFHRRRRR